MLKLTQQEYVTVPVVIKAEVLLASVVCMWGKPLTKLPACAQHYIFHLCTSPDCLSSILKQLLKHQGPSAAAHRKAASSPVIHMLRECRQSAYFWRLQTSERTQVPKVTYISSLHVRLTTAVLHDSLSLCCVAGAWMLTQQD